MDKRGDNMTRHNVIVAYKRDKRCPVCDRYGNKSYKGLAMHIAMMRDDVHTEWRMKNNLPVDYIHLPTKHTISKIMEIFGWCD